VVVQRSNGLIGRLVSLLASIEETAAARHQTQVTAAVVDAAATRLQGLAATSLEHSLAPQPELGPAAAIVAPVLAFTVTENAIGAPRASIPALNIPRRDKSIARMAGAAAVLFALIGVAIYSWAHLGVSQLRAEGPTTPGPRHAVDSASADAAIIVRLPFPPAASQAQSDKPDADNTSSLVAAAEVIKPPVPAAAQIGAAAPGVRRLLVKAGIARTRGGLGGYATQPNRGTWPVPPGVNGGG